MLGEELFNAAVEIELVFWPSETVPLVWIDHVCHFAFCFAQRGDHRVCVSQCDSRIVLALTDQKWSADRIDMVKRRNFSIPVLVVIDISLTPTPTCNNV